MSETHLTVFQPAAKPIGILPLRCSRSFARLLREIRVADPELAQRIREQACAAQAAAKEVRRLLARHRLRVRRVPVLSFPRAAR